ncbi:MAG: hypothetical protein NVS9B15_10410 [Acidobacteriaceae bacterium]
MLRCMNKLGSSDSLLRRIGACVPVALFFTLTCISSGGGSAQTPKREVVVPASLPDVTKNTEFGPVAAEALVSMRKRAAELNITGVAVVAYFEGDRIEGWDSRMAVVGRMKDEPSATGKGNNLIGIAYSKAAEMADTLKDSGSQVRPPLTGEFGWSGGVIVRGRRGYLIAAFSGGKSEDDVKVSQAGAETLSGKL